ncbi:MAG TPA: amidohydrolase family protein [Chloroflexota bacterium]|jgi:4-oxalmesaconate hydratase
MIIDIHGHYTTAPAGLDAYRGSQISQLGNPVKGKLNVSDAEIRESIENSQLRIQRDRGTDVTIFSPRASGMGHHFGNALISRYWAETCNELIDRVCRMFPENFVGVCQLPQSPGVSPANCVEELERCVNELGFVGCNLNPDPSGGWWTDPPMTDRWWYPIYEKMVELDVPAMIHVSASCNPNFHATGAHYINGDTTVFMQCIQQPQLFKDFPSLRFIIPHGGGAVPFHWGRYRGIALDMGRGELNDFLMGNIFFDTCVYHQPGMELLINVVGADSVLFASEMVGAVRGIDPNTGRNFDDTKVYLDAMSLTDEQRHKLFEGNARKVYPRLSQALAK